MVKFEKQFTSKLSGANKDKIFLRYYRLEEFPIKGRFNSDGGVMTQYMVKSKTESFNVLKLLELKKISELKSLIKDKGISFINKMISRKIIRINLRGRALNTLLVTENKAEALTFLKRILPHG